MISKELFSEITHIPINANGMSCDGYSFEHHLAKINIYELASKCKEWAYKAQKFPIKLETSPTDEYGEDYAIGYWFLCGIEGTHPKTNNTIPNNTLVYYGQSEPEAIFKACQWILENK